MSRDLIIPVSTVTVNGYDASAFRPYFTGTVSGSSSQGTTYLYAGDPGMSMSISNTSATISANQLSVQLKSINGTTYSALGKTSSSTVGSICEEVDIHVYDCIDTPVTITGDTTVTLPHTY